MEMLVALAVLGVALAFAVPAFRPTSMRLSAVGSDMVDVLRSARAAAISQGYPAQVLIEAGRHRISGPRGRVLEAPQGADLAYADGLGRYLPEGGPIVFYPDGSASGGSVSLSSNGRRWQADVDWVTGRIAVAVD